jgi:hypothetical protein
MKKNYQLSAVSIQSAGRRNRIIFSLTVIPACPESFFPNASEKQQIPDKPTIGRTEPPE